jgi:hypothetical protein
MKYLYTVQYNKTIIYIHDQRAYIYTGTFAVKLNSLFGVVCEMCDNSGNYFTCKLFLLHRFELAFVHNVVYASVSDWFANKFCYSFQLLRAIL